MAKPLPAFSAPSEFERLHVRPRLNSGRVLIAGSKVYKGREDRRQQYLASAVQVVGVDALDGDGVDVVCDLESPQAADRLGRFVHVDCLSVLEHSKRPWLVASTLEAVMEPGATLFLAVPFVWRVHGYPSDYFRFTIEGVRSLFPRIDWSHLVYGHSSLTTDMSGMGLKVNGYKYFPRTEVFGFGVRSWD